MTQVDVLTSEPINPRHGHRIVCAGIKLVCGKVICGVRHMDAVMRGQLPDEYEPALNVLRGSREGFVDNKYQFLNREEAWKVAAAAGQIRVVTGTHGTLYSEDLW